MKKANFIFLLIIVWIPFKGIAQSYDEVKNEIDKIVLLDAQLDLKKIPNMIIGIANGDSTFYYNYSFNPDRQVLLDQNSLFELGDLSKAMTSMICYLLAEKGVVNLSDSLEIYSETKDTSIIFPASIEQLLSHRSGLPLRPREFGTQEEDLNNPYANYSKSELITHFLQNEYEIDDDQSFFYSHFGYALIEIYIEQQTNLQFESLAKLFIKKCNLTNTYISASDSINLIKGYDRAGKVSTRRKYASFGAAEGFSSSAEDLLRIACKTWKNREPWLSKSFSQYWKMPNTKKTKVSTGWYVHELKKFSNVIIQSGSSEGHRSFLGFVPETKTAVVVLSDSLDSHAGVGFLILKMLNQEWKHPLGKK